MLESDSVMRDLISLCKEMEILPAELQISENDDLFEYGIFDSMGLTLLTSIMEEHYDVHISTQLMLVELRTPKAIADYIVEHQCVDVETL